MGDLRPSMGAALSAFGVPATVTRPAPADTTPIITTIIWLSPVLIDSPGGGDFQRKDVRRVAALTRADVPTAPRGTRIDAAERDGDPVQAWQVDEPEVYDADHTRVVVVPLE